MAVMSKIPTFCILGDFQDPLRDKMFINQYEQDEILKVFRYKNINESSKRYNRKHQRIFSLK